MCVFNLAETFHEWFLNFKEIVMALSWDICVKRINLLSVHAELSYWRFYEMKSWQAFQLDRLAKRPEC